jgi:threonine dehydratase
MIPESWFQDARLRIYPYAVKTPLTYDPILNIFLKWENRQVSGSFKIRGALNKVLSMQPREYKNGIVTSSAGNHGLGVAIAGKIANTPVHVFVSDHAIESKINKLKENEAFVKNIRGSYGEVEKSAIQYAIDHKLAWISPYNDGQVIAGQGTITLELLEENPSLSEATWVVPVGGGGLVSGISICLKETIDQFPSLTRQYKRLARIIAVQSDASSYMHSYFHTGNQYNCLEAESVADGLAGAIEDESITFPIISKYVDDVILVRENEIIEGIKYAWDNYQEIIEGSAAVSLAAVLTGQIIERPIVLIISGGNIQPQTHNKIIGNN